MVWFLTHRVCKQMNSVEMKPDIVSKCEWKKRKITRNYKSFNNQCKVKTKRGERIGCIEVGCFWSFNIECAVLQVGVCLTRNLRDWSRRATSTGNLACPQVGILIAGFCRASLRHTRVWKLMAEQK